MQDKLGAPGSHLETDAHHPVAHEDVHAPSLPATDEAVQDHDRKSDELETGAEIDDVELHVHGSPNEGEATHHAHALTPSPPLVAGPCTFQEPRSSGSRRRSSTNMVLPFSVATAVAAGALLWRRLRGRRQRAGAPGPVDLGPEHVVPTLVCQADIPGAPNPKAPLAPMPLAGLRFVVSEDFDVQGLPTTAGVEPWRSDEPPAAETAPAVQRTLAAGASLVGKAMVQELAHTTLGLNVVNAANRVCMSGGGATGAVAAVATGLADFSLAWEEMGSLLLPAACQGVPAFASTPGPLGTHSALTAAAAAAGVPILGSVGAAAADASSLLRVGTALGLPGNANLRGEIMKVVVAEDLFKLCGQELQPAVLAVKRAILKWAGSDQAGSVQLLKFLAGSMSNWRDMPIAGAPPPVAEGGPQPNVLASLREAAVALQLRGVAARYAGRADKAATAAAAAAAAGADSGEEAAVVAAAAETPALATALLSAAGDVGDEAAAAAAAVAAEVAEVVRTTVKADTVVVVPLLPAAPLPARDAPDGEVRDFLRRVQFFTCIPALAQCPAVALPAGTTADGKPLSVALFSIPRSDLRLLAVAAKMAPLIQQAADAAKGAAQAGTVASTATSAGTGTASTAGSATNGPANGSRKSSDGGGGGKGVNGKGASTRPPPDAKTLEKAEKAKARGNEFFKATKYTEAIKEYSKALQLHPDSAVYYSNRAMACLKIFRFDQAEDDCSRALKLEPKEADKVKALLRRGTARMGLHKFEEAAKDFNLVLAFEPNNRQARDELQALKEMMEEMRASQQRMLADMPGAGGLGNGGPHGGLPPGYGGMMPPDMDYGEDMMGPEAARMYGLPGGGGMPGYAGEEEYEEGYDPYAAYYAEQ